MRVCKYVFCIILVQIIATPLLAIEGDVELLKLIADGYEANKEKIRTWGGSIVVEFSNVSEKAGDSIQEGWKRHNKVEFLIDNNFGATRWINRYEEVDYQKGKEEKRIPSNYSGIIKSGQGHQMFYDSENEKIIRTLEILPPKNIIRTEGSITFDPANVWEHIYPVSRTLRYWYEKTRSSKKLPLNRTLVRQGDIVTFEVRSPSKDNPSVDIVNRLVFDISKGCQLVEFVSASPGLEGQWKLDYEKIGDVFVIKEMSKSHIDRSSGKEIHQEIKATLINKLVNKPVDPREFEFDKIGLRPGDYVLDRTAGNMHYEWKKPNIEASEVLQERKAPGNTSEILREKKENLDTGLLKNVPEKSPAIVQNAPEKPESAAVDANNSPINKTASKSLVVWGFVILLVGAAGIIFGKMFRKKKGGCNISGYMFLIAFLSVLCLLFAAEAGDGCIKPQCAQYCVYHCCQILGVPVSMEQVMQLLPPKESGESMLEIAETLKRTGLDCSGEKASFEELAAGTFPVIAHLVSPTKTEKEVPHFIVVEKIDSTAIKIVDGYARGMMAKETFLKEWDGYLLRVKMPAGSLRKPDFLPAAAEKSPRLQFDTLFIDVGDVPQKEEDVIFTFPFKNIGAGDLHISKVKTNCKCAVVDDPPKVMRPGESGRISVRYKFGESRGRFSQTAIVQSDDPYFPQILLTLVGNGSQEVRIEPKQLDFGNVVAGETSLTRCYVTYTGDGLFKVQSVKSGVDGLTVEFQTLTPSLYEKLRPEAKSVTVGECVNRFVIEAVVDSKKVAPDQANLYIEINTNLPDASMLKIPVAFKVIPPVVARPSKLFLGEFTNNQPVEATVVLKSVKGFAISVDDVNCGHSGLSCSYPSKNNSDRIELKFSGQITSQDQIDKNEIVVRVNMSGSENPLTVKLPISGLLRSSRPSDKTKLANQLN